MADEATPLEPLVIPEDLTGLTDEELEAAITECNERAVLLTSKDAPELDTATAVELIENAVATGEALDAEQAKRDEARAEAEEILAQVKARLEKRLNPDAVDDEDDEDDEPEPDTEPTAAEEPAEEPERVVEETREPEPVLAATRPNRALRRAKQHEPTQARSKTPSMMALKDLPGKFAAGEDINLAAAAELISDTWNRTHAVSGPRQDVPLLRFSIDTPESRMLGEDESENLAKLMAVVGPEALVATGGVCAPPEPYYDFLTLSGAQTPVVDSIARFGAARGGIRWMTPYTLVNISTGVGQITNASDLLGGTNSVKTCQVLPCPAQQTAFIDAIYHCLTISNMGARTTPELVTHFTQLLMAAFARVRETKALDAIKAGSTTTTMATFGGFTNTLLGALLQAAEGMRSRHRMADSAVMRVWLPAWTQGALAEDLIRQQFARFDVLNSGGYKSFVTSHLRALQIAPTFYIDGDTGGGQVFGAQGANSIDPFPALARIYIAPEGTWVRLDGGTMDFGIVRDSVLNSTNDFQVFGEVFETYAKLGPESIRIDVDVCANGEVTLPKVAVCGSAL